MSDPIHIVCAADGKYGSDTGIMLSSLVRTNPGQSFHVHLLSDAVHARDAERMRRMIAKTGGRFSVYDVAAKLDEHAGTMKAISYVSRTTYARLFVGRYLPPEIKRFIYLDGDIVCRAPLRDLWTAAETCTLIAAVPNKSDKPVLDEARTRLGMPPEAGYFNMGVIALNLENWSDRKAGERVLEFLNANAQKIRWGEQDAINAVLWSDIAQLPEHWNVQLGAYSVKEAERRLPDAVLVHYTGTYKPWQFGYRGAGGALFRQAKAASPWRFMLPELRLSTRLQKSLRKKLQRTRAAS